MAGLVPAIHVFCIRGAERHGCPRQARARRCGSPCARVFLAQLEALDLARRRARKRFAQLDPAWKFPRAGLVLRSEEHTSELQSLRHLVCRLLLEKKKKKYIYTM